jgi:hypothetical protein
MSYNRIKYFIRNILQSSQLNREKFVKNKKVYNVAISKNKINNHILINKRSYSTNFSYLPPSNNNNNNNNNNNLLYAAGMLIMCYFTLKK